MSKSNAEEKQQEDVIIPEYENQNPHQVLTRDWYAKLEAQAAANFINLPIEFQLRGYDYNFISKSYLHFFQANDSNTRDDKLILARKFLKFIRSVNKNRAKQELGEDFFICFDYFMNNFPDLLSKQDMVHLETLNVITEAIDKSSFIEDIISVDELKRRVENLEKIHENEQVIQADWQDFEEEYQALNSKNPQERDKYLALMAMNPDRVLHKSDDEDETDKEVETLQIEEKTGKEIDAHA